MRLFRDYEEISTWEKEHMSMLNNLAPEHFEIHHYATIVDLVVKK